jgi:tRNA (guanosine-2'-O-)-methyltransferase
MAKARSFVAPDPELVRKVLLRAEQHPLFPQVERSRVERMVQVATRRLSSVTLAVENLWDTHNVSAVLRSAEGLGLMDVHVVEHPQRFKKHRGITHGADRWLNVHRYSSATQVLDHLSEAGFLICAADVGAGCVPVTEVPVDRPLAVVVGSEKDGLSETTRERADMRFSIPMTGFTGSFNVSVSAAISLWEITRQRRESMGRAGDLHEPQIDQLVRLWIDSNTTAGKKQANRPRRATRPDVPPETASKD